MHIAQWPLGDGLVFTREGTTDDGRGAFQIIARRDDQIGEGGPPNGAEVPQEVMDRAIETGAPSVALIWRDVEAIDQTIACLQRVRCYMLEKKGD